MSQRQLKSIEARMLLARRLGYFDLANHYANRAEQVRKGWALHPIYGDAAVLAQQSTALSLVIWQPAPLT